MRFLNRMRGCLRPTCGWLFGGLVVCILQLAGVSEPVFGQSTSVVSLQQDWSPDKVLYQCEQLERDRQWSEALALYQQALRKTPNDARLTQRRSLARIHFDLERRYADSSFLQQISRTPPKIAEGTYAEVLLKIQSYYVDEPNWNEIARYGLTALKFALEAPEFREQHLSGVSLDRIKNGFNELTDVLKKVSVQKRVDANWVATQSAKMLRASIDLPEQATYMEFICGAIAVLDPYSAYLSDNQYSETMSQIDGNFVGLGVELKSELDHLAIVNVIRGGPAEQGGLRGGDKITHVDFKSVSQFGSERVADLLRGEEGSEVVVTVVRGENAPQTAKFTRRRVEIPSVEIVQMVDEQGGVGYIRVANFQKTTVRDFDAALWSLQRQGMRSLIVDMRGNPGGLLSAAVDLADRFISNGVIVATKGRNPLEDFTHRADSTGTWRMPLYVLIDENSASASEIFAAAIRDQGRGKVIGTQSYGKGSVQGIFALNVSGGGIRLTTAKFYGPKGDSINQIGVKPDVEVRSAARPDYDGQLQPVGDDQVLQTAISYARQNSSPNEVVVGR
ncbi:MAG: PDZ domain-containing protein [Pirellulaceae bacterium]|nr:PDZ domain-containing protein [Pirellulaceae bacterium]